MVEFCGAYVQYRNQAVLENINLEIDSGDFLALFGSDDVGKSVLCHTIAGYAVCKRGMVKVFGQNVTSLRQSDYKRIRFVPDEALVERMPVRRFFDMVSHSCSSYDKELQCGLCEKYNIDITERMDRMTYQNNKLVQIIAAMCSSPELFVIDESKNYLTDNVWQMVCEDMRKMNEAGTTIIAAVENYEDINGYCNCYACLRDKHIIAAENIEADECYHPAKVVTVTGGNQRYIDNICQECILDKDDTGIFVFEGEINRLNQAISKAGCTDWTVENMLLEEKLAGDYTRWG